MTDDSIGQLLPVSNAKIGGAPVQTVDGRTLHAFLRVGKDFTTWIKDRIASYGFEEGVDYVRAEHLGSPNSGNQTGRGGDRRSVSYHLSLDMAKELAMVERNAEGKRARLYFIACERRAKALPIQAQQPKRAATGGNTPLVARTFRAYHSIARLLNLDGNQAALSAARATKAETGTDPLAALGVMHLLAPQQDAHLTPTDIGVRLDGKSSRAVNALLEQHGYQAGTRDAKGVLHWEPTEKGRPFAVFLDTGKRQGDGSMVRQLRWSADIVAAVRTDMAAAPAAQGSMLGELN